MKIIYNDKIYVQKNDIAHLNSTDMEIPASIFMKIFDNGIVIIDDSNRYEFVEFNDPEEIKFFEEIDWIVDYNEVKDLTGEEIIKSVQKIQQERNEIAEKFNSMGPKERKKHMDMYDQCESLNYKTLSLRDIFLFKRGELKMKLPEGVEYPIDYVHEEKGIKKLIKTMFKKDNRKN